MANERLYSPEKYASLGNDARIDECTAIAEAATNHSILFPMKKDCMREIEEVQGNIKQFLPERCAACQILLTSESKKIRVELEKYTPHERTWIACSDECAKILKGAA